MGKFINPLDNLDRYSLDDKGIGNAFADSVKGESRYVADEKSWFYYDGVVWKKDHNSLHVREKAKKYLDYLRKLKKEIEDRKNDPSETDNEKAFIAVVKGLANCGERKTMLDEAMSVHPLNKSDFDTKMNLLNCLNFTIDLDTGEPKKQDPEDFITKVAPVKFNPNAKYPRWADFTLEIMDNDVETAKYLQKILGYGTTGETSQECMFIFYGPTTRNGKGTLMESVMNVLGDYALNMQPDSLAKRKRYSGSTATPDIARNVGVRLVSVNEPAEDMVLDAAIVKQLTGSDTITTRFLYGNSFDYRPQFKLYISTNHLPAVTDDTLFSSGRIKVILFKRHFEEDKQDRNLKNLFRIEESKSAILNWLLEGLKMYQSAGLEAPESVVAATSSYRQETDTLGLFIKEATIKNANAKTKKTSDVYKIYVKWCKDSCLTAVKLKSFVGLMRNAGYVKRDGTLGNVVFGLYIKPII
jgi:putative DNA primase/helicase